MRTNRRAGDGALPKAAHTESRTTAVSVCRLSGGPHGEAEHQGHQRHRDQQRAE